MSFGGRTSPVLVFPAAGQAGFKAQDHLLDMQAKAAAIAVAPGCPIEIVGSARSVVVARLDEHRLQSTLATMLGAEQKTSAPLALQGISQVALTRGSVSFDQAFRALFHQIDAYANNPHMLDISGIDDVFYRTLAIAMNPNAFIRAAQARLSPPNARRIDNVCQYIRANLSKPITLTSLESIGHMSRRALHNAFMKTYGVSPMGWLREQRMLAVRAMLEKNTSALTVTQALYSCGFTNPSLFSQQYDRRFGELPSATQNRSRA
jgi:AraC-like DNA-binding protein